VNMKISEKLVWIIFISSLVIIGIDCCCQYCCLLPIRLLLSPHRELFFLSRFLFLPGLGWRHGGCLPRRCLEDTMFITLVSLRLRVFPWKLFLTGQFLSTADTLSFPLFSIGHIRRSQVLSVETDGFSQSP